MTHREARRIVRETREWLATQSDTAPFAEFDRQKSKLWDVYVSRCVPCSEIPVLTNVLIITGCTTYFTITHPEGFTALAPGRQFKEGMTSFESNPETKVFFTLETRSSDAEYQTTFHLWHI